MNRKTPDWLCHHGVQLLDDTLYPDKSYFDDKPEIKTVKEKV